MNPQPFSIVPGSLSSGLVVVCDHASNRLPPAYGTLGLAPHDLLRHIAFDIGAAGVARDVASMLGAPAVFSGVSRLLIDCNRGIDDPTLVMRLSDGAIVEGNRHLSASELQHRLSAYYEPYHAAIAGIIDAAIAAGHPPIILSIHTFTPVWRGLPRPWHCGVLWDRDARLALRLIEALRRDASLVVGDNEPYSGRLEGDCLWRHGTCRGLAHAIVEIRQDLVAVAAGEREWAVRLARIIDELLANPHDRSDLNAIRREAAQPLNTRGQL